MFPSLQIHTGPNQPSSSCRFCQWSNTQPGENMAYHWDIEFPNGCGCFVEDTCFCGFKGRTKGQASILEVPSERHTQMGETLFVAPQLSMSACLRQVHAVRWPAQRASGALADSNSDKPATPLHEFVFKWGTPQTSGFPSGFPSKPPQ